ncbi:MAG: phage minor capsid protein [Lachnospiraceae bacterium]|nr:phage minor capsid protein [Lachnospiraceae bacterium]MDY2614255.1 phage minor capsid protein [Lachnospiraceae bacterium]MDY4207781.1 phage minor capsid protein [Lachnospiraceae bacterium]
MMTQGELESIPIPFEQAMSDLEMRIMSEIVRAIKINGFSTSTADNQINCLIQMGQSEKEIRNQIRNALGVTDAEIEKIFSDAVYEQYYGYSRAYKNMGAQQIPFEKNLELQVMIAAVSAQTKNTFRNITNSLGFAILNPATGKISYSPLMQFYQDALTNAVMDISSGAISYDKALNQAINTMTTSGLRWIDYDSGWHNRVNVAARRAVMTGFRQVQGKINEQVASDLGTDSYEVSYHIGARPEHQMWQGRVYTYEQLQTVCGLGTVTGLHGLNCYHDYNAFIPGVSVRTYTDEQLSHMMADENTLKLYNGKSYTTYEALQEQRKMETVMRKTRQDIKLLQEGNASKDSITLKKAKYQGQMQKYKAFSSAMKLPEQMQRVYQDGLGRISIQK